MMIIHPNFKKKYHSLIVSSALLMTSACHQHYPVYIEETNGALNSRQADDQYVESESSNQTKKNKIHVDGEMYINTSDGQLFRLNSPFFHYLSEGYRDLAQQENYEHHFNEEDVFGSKSKLAKDGISVQPHQVRQRNVPPWSISELQNARDQLMQMLSSGSIRQYPYLTAHSQVMFDCWLEEQEENINQHDIDICRDDFYKTINKLEMMLNKEPNLDLDDSKKCQCPTDTSSINIEAKSFILYFDLDSAELTSESIVIIKEIYKAAVSLNPKLIIVQGHTDRSGIQSYNQELSQKRVNSTMAGLVIAGLDKEKIQQGHFGEDRPRVVTKDGKILAENRRVEIVFEF